MPGLTNHSAESLGVPSGSGSGVFPGNAEADGGTAPGQVSVVAVEKVRADGGVVLMPSGNTSVSFNNYGPVSSHPVRLVVGLVPGRVSGFVERVGVLGRVEGLRRPGCGTVVLHGDGGHGKTQLAVDLFRRAEVANPDGGLFVWVDATRFNSVLAGLTLAAEALGVARPQDRGNTELGAQQFLQALRSWDGAWIVVLDNLYDADRLTSDHLWPVGGPLGQGLTVVTTRLRDHNTLHGQGRDGINVEVFTPDEAHQYLTGMLKDAPGPVPDQASLHEIATELGFLPLVLGLAAAYLREPGANGVADYLRRFRGVLFPPPRNTRNPRQPRLLASPRQRR